MLKGFLNSVSSNPEGNCILIDGKAYSYREIDALSDNIAAVLFETAAGEKLVGLYTDNNVQTYVSLLAILKAGKGFVPLNHKFPDVRLRSVIEESELKTILACNGSDERLSALKEGIRLIHPDKETGTRNFQIPGENEDAIAYILFTSGSTGKPKGIPITGKNFAALMEGLKTEFRLTKEDRVLQAFELSFDVSLACVFLAWEYASTLVVADLNGITAVNAFKAIYENKVTFVTLPPSALFYLKRLKLVGTVPLPFVHTTLFTGEALPYSVVKDWRTCAADSVIVNAYGPTEVTVWCLLYTLNENSEKELVNGLCPIGHGLKEVMVRIVDEKNADVQPGTRGELLVGGEQVCQAYHNNELKTKESIFTDSNGVRWYRTGDIVVKNEGGNIVYVNRKDNQVQVNGYRVELGEVEFGLRNALGNNNAVVLAKETNGVTELFGFAEGKFEKEKILGAMRNTLPAYMIPRDIFSVSVLPVNTSGKIDKMKLREDFLA